MNKILFLLLVFASFVFTKTSTENIQKINSKKIYDEVFELLKEEKYDRAYGKLLPLARSGENEAMLAVGNLHYHGKGAKQSYKEAFKWYKKALQHGNKQVKFILANMYKDAIGTDRAYHKAFDLYLQSAIESENVKSMFFVSAMYYHGNGIRRDFKKAYEWGKKASDKREPRASFLLGLLYFKGHGVEKDLDKAFRYANMSKALGNQEAPKLVEMIKKESLRKLIKEKEKKDLWVIYL